MRHIPTLSLLAVGVCSTMGCDAIANLRAMFHPEEQQAPKQTGEAGLRVDVEPESGITILLDGKRVATESPYVDENLTAGPHRLEVRAMGFQSFTLPIQLKNRQLVTIPVKLLPRAQSPKPPPAIAPLPTKSGTPPDPPPPPAPMLPPGVDPIVLSAVPKPPAPVLLDLQVVDADHIVLKRVHGTLTVADIPLRYRIGGAGLLTIFIPEDGAQWFKHRAPIKNGGQIKLHRGALRLRRITSAGGEQAIVLRRQK